MSAYFLARISVHDPQEYQRYLDAVDEVFARFKGEYLVVDPAPRPLEGEWPCGRVVLIRFPSEEDLRAWYFSPEYQRILLHRLGGARCDAVIVQGKA